MVRSRLRILIAFLALPFAVVLGRLAAVQLFHDSEGDDELDRAESRRRRIVLLPPTRGSILDRQGSPLARDITTFDLEFTVLELHPRERCLPILERALELCDDRCRAEARTAGYGEMGGCRGGIIEEHLHLVLEELDQLEGRPDPILVDNIPPALRQRVHQRFSVGLKAPDGLKELEKMLGLYFLPAAGGNTYELRARPREALAMELALGRIAELTGKEYAELRAAVKAGEIEIASAGNRTEREIFRGQRRLLVSDINDRALTDVVYQPELYPGIRVVNGRRRFYPRGESVAALVGFLRGPGQRELAEGLILDRYPLDVDFVISEQFDLVRRLGSREGDLDVGTRGLEEYYDSRLRGAYGVRVEEIDARRVPQKDLFLVPAERGQDLRTSLDMELQDLLFRSLEDLCIPRGDTLAGCAVVMDLTGRAAADGSRHPGAILAAAGFPGFSPDRMMKDRSYLAELEQKEKDLHQGILLDRPFQVFQQPGSVFKLVVAAAAMESGTERPAAGGRPVPSPLSPATRYRCTHFLEDSPARLRCLSPNGHGQPDREVDLVQALQYSCNIYFYRLGRERLQPGILWAWARQLGYGRSAGIDLGDPAPDPRPPRAMVLKANVRPEGMIQYAIGHGQVTASALQVLRSVAGIALGGTQLPWPFLAGGRPPEPLKLGRETVAALREGMRRVVHAPGGTAAEEGLGLSRYRVAAKTGTAELRDGDPKAPDPRDRPLNYAWIAGYAPFDRPEIAFVALLEKTALHGGDCARVLRPVLERLEEREPGKYRLPGARGPAPAAGGGR